VPTFDAASSAKGVSVNSLSWSHTCSASADRSLSVAGAMRRLSTEFISNVTYNSVGLTAMNSNANGLAFCGAWHLVAPASGANTVAITLSGAVSGILGMAVSLTDAEQLDPVNPADILTTNGNGTSSNLNVNSNTTMLVMDAICRLHTGGSLAVGSGQTERVDDFDSGGWCEGGMSTQPGDDPTTAMSWNFTSSNFAHVAWRIKAPAGGGGGGSHIPVFIHHYQQQGIC
jgi:hypothetical protein